MKLNSLWQNPGCFAPLSFRSILLAGDGHRENEIYLFFDRFFLTGDKRGSKGSKKTTVQARTYTAWKMHSFSWFPLSNIFRLLQAYLCGPCRFHRRRRSKELYQMHGEESLYLIPDLSRASHCIPIIAIKHPLCASHSIPIIAKKSILFQQTWKLSV